MSYAPEIIPTMICDNIINNPINADNIWKKCFLILKNNLIQNPSLNSLTSKFTQFNLEELSQNDYISIWKWMINEYYYQGNGYRSSLLEDHYFKNKSIQDYPRQFFKNAPTNTYRTLKSYFSNNTIGNKEKEIINKCLIDFFNMCIGVNRRFIPYCYELKPLLTMWTVGMRRVKEEPPLTNAELEQSINNMRQNGPIPDDIVKEIASFLKKIEPTTQNAGKRSRKTKSKKHKRRKTIRRKTIRRKTIH